MNKPVGQLDEHELELLFGQGTDAHYLVPVALDQLRGDGSVNPGLLRCLIRLNEAFWRDHPYLLTELVVLVNARLAAPDDSLAYEMGAFVARHRKR